MAKQLRQNETIYIAPDISGYLDANYIPVVIDERNQTPLNPADIEDKITIYERQVIDWFLNPARNLLRFNSKNKGFIVLMICLSYFEGVEQYRRGTNSNGNSTQTFIDSIQRIFPNQFIQNNLRGLYVQARCGLFHNGMVSGRIIINNSFTDSILFENNDIKINPKRLFNIIFDDFQNYILNLRNPNETLLRQNFDNMYSNL